LNGRAIVLSYAVDGGAQFFMAYFNTFRRQFWQNLFLGEPRESRLLMGPDAARCYRQTLSESVFYAVMNPTLDSWNNVSIRVHPAPGVGKWQCLTPSGSWDEIQPDSSNTATTIFSTPIAPLESLFLVHHRFTST